MTWTQPREEQRRMNLATCEQQNRNTRARHVGDRARRYQEEWIRQLRQRGVNVNGTHEEYRANLALQNYKSPARRKPTTLAQAVRAFDRALAAGKVRYAPVPELDAWAEEHGFDYQLAALERLPNSDIVQVDRLKRWGCYA